MNAAQRRGARARRGQVSKGFDDGRARDAAQVRHQGGPSRRSPPHRHLLPRDACAEWQVGRAVANQHRYAEGSRGSEYGTRPAKRPYLHGTEGVPEHRRGNQVPNAHVLHTPTCCRPCPSNMSCLSRSTRMGPHTGACPARCDNRSGRSNNPERVCAVARPSASATAQGMWMSL